MNIQSDTMSLEPGNYSTNDSYSPFDCIVEEND